jgi:hypothetical protein
MDPSSSRTKSITERLKTSRRQEVEVHSFSYFKLMHYPRPFSHDWFNPSGYDDSGGARIIE